jgi:hypothetical protein
MVAGNIYYTENNVGIDPVRLSEQEDQALDMNSRGYTFECKGVSNPGSIESNYRCE